MSDLINFSATTPSLLLTRRSRTSASPALGMAIALVLALPLGV